jgi:hypothetical protein
MSKKSDAAVGRLAVMDGALNQLLREIVTEIGVKVGDSKKVAEDLLQVVKSHPSLFTKEMTEWLEGVVRAGGKRDVSGLTTGKAAQVLLAHAKSDAALLPHEVTAWLKRVDQAAIKRNTIMHAIAHDQCVICGNATRFAHKGKPVDRSAQAVAVAVAEFRDLVDEGVKHARVISEALNERTKAAATQEAAATSKIQSPRQVLIGQTMYRCANCSPGGKAITSVALPTAVAVLPPDS